MPPRPAPSRIAQALEYLQGLKSGVGEFVGGVGSNLADRIGTAGGLAYEALTSDPNIGRMTTAEFSEAAANRAPTPRLDQTARDLGTIGSAIVTQPVQTGKAIVQGEIARARGALDSPEAAGEYAGSFIDPMRIAAALRHRAPIAELDVYHGTPHRFPATEANPLGEFDASKIGTGEGAQAYGHGIYLAELPGVAEGYKKTLSQSMNDGAQRRLQAAGGDIDKAISEASAKADIYRQGGANSYASVVEEDLRGLQQYKQAGKFESGSLYKADLPDEMIGRMLDWDKPLSEQPAAVQKALRELADLGDEESNARWLLSGNNDPKTSALFKAIGDALPGTDRMDAYPGSAQLSAELAKRGIPGIRYLDAGSRGQGGSGTRNFVVFPGEEKKVRILERK